MPAESEFNVASGNPVIVVVLHQNSLMPDIQEQHGVAYCFGSTFAVRAVVSLWSMRRANNWDRPVAIVQIGFGARTDTSGILQARSASECVVRASQSDDTLAGASCLY